MGLPKYWILLFFVNLSTIDMSAQIGLPSPYGKDKGAPTGKNFELQFELDKTEKGYTLNMVLDLAKGSYIISPFSQDSFYLNYTITYTEADGYLQIGEIQEFPTAIEELDPYIEKRVKLVRTNTVYTQNLLTVSNEDFEVSGIVEFLVEPSCIPYDINFVITQTDGLLTIKNDEPIISSEYKL